MLRLLFFIVLLNSFLSSIAQTEIHWKCGSDVMRQQNFNKNPKTKIKNDSIENIFFLKQQQQLQHKKLGGGLPTVQQVYIIPVVVHIIHNNGAENISDAQVIAGIQHLNDAFRNVGVFDPSTGVDVEIEFCLAKQDENGNFTTGINRLVSGYTNMVMETEDLNLKNLIRWDPTKYMNVWLVKEITSLSTGSGVVGYAFFPASYGQPEDGLVVETNYFGSTSDNSKVAVHEVGHYLGLYHTFEGGCSNNNCLTEGDKICDTPPDASTAPVSCIGTVNTCSSDDDDLSVNNPFRPVLNGGLGDQNDMLINYMDYGNIACFSGFTSGQKNRMVTSLTAIRNSLLQSIACNTLCPNPITASFNVSATAVVAGTSVSFTNLSTGANDYIWQVNGITFSTSTNASYIFNTQGTYTVKLIAANGDPACTTDFSIIITVTCPVTASFTASSTAILPGDNVTFTNTSIGATSYEWYLDGIQQSTATNFNYIFSVNGGFSVYLIASNGVCSDTVYQYIKVGSCSGKEGNNWNCLQYAGLDFSSSNPVIVQGNVMPFNEGNATISDKVTGQLLFYTNGVNVWDKNNTQMPNGFGLLGNISSTQSAIIVPIPESDSLYYIFTVDAFAGYAGLQYSIVDMSLNAGNGDVTTKNQLLLNTTDEKVTAVKHCNGKDIWVITHQWNSNAFYSYLVTSTGISTPVISNVGPVHQDMGDGYSWESFGYLKASPNGKKIAAAIYEEMNEVEIFDFDNSTGVIYNPIVDTSYLEGIGVYEGPYGVSFSPDNSKLYICTDPNSDYQSSVYQYNLLAGSPSAILASKTLIYADPFTLSSLQLANNGKIYVMGFVKIDVINNPNSLGLACNYSTVFNNLGSPYLNYTGLGVPNFIESYFNQPSIIGLEKVCTNAQNITYSTDRCSGTATWLLNGQATILNYTDSTITLNFNDSTGINTLVAEIITDCGITRDTLLITVMPLPLLELGVDTVICQGSTINLNAGSGYSSYLWQDGSTDFTYVVSNPGLYKVTVTTSSGCIVTDSITVTAAQLPDIINLGPDINTCNGSIAVLDAGIGFESYEWQDNSDNQTLTAYLPGTYWVTVSACGNTSSDTVKFIWDNNVPFTIEQEGELCAGSNAVLKVAPTNLASYLWDDGTSDVTRPVEGSGIYSLIATNQMGCYGEDSIEVFLSDCNDCILTVPTAFSPNGDGHNDLFVLHGFENCVSNFSLLIFDRWGEKVFETKNTSASWNGIYKGKLINSGVFVYYMEATLINGQSINKKGNISLIK